MLLRDRVSGMAIALSAMVMLLGAWSIGHAQETNQVKGELKVTILVYSGRPNPTYSLEGEGDIGKVKEFIGKAKKTEFGKDTVVPSILGYNGVVVENVSRVSGLPESLTVYRGNIEARDGRTTFLGDENRDFERFLLQQGIERKVIDTKLLGVLGVKIGTWPTPE